MRSDRSAPGNFSVPVYTNPDVPDLESFGPRGAVRVRTLLPIYVVVIVGGPTPPTPRKGFGNHKLLVSETFTGKKSRSVLPPRTVRT